MLQTYWKCFFMCYCLPQNTITAMSEFAAYRNTGSTTFYDYMCNKRRTATPTYKTYKNTLITKFLYNVLDSVRDSDGRCATFYISFLHINE